MDEKTNDFFSNVLFIPHGGGPLPLLDSGGHQELVDFLNHITSTLTKPSAILVISAHWEEDVPTLYKQYADLCDDGGVRYIDFNVDANFGHCIDGLIMTDMSKLKAKKRLRYIGA